MKGIAKFVLILTAICVVSWTVAAVLFFSIYFDYDINNPKYYQQISSFEESTLSGIDQININFLSEDIILNETNAGVATFNLTGFIITEDTILRQNWLLKKLEMN